MRITVILAAIALVAYLAQRILASGKGWLEFAIRVTGLSEILGKTVIDFIMQYQKYFWWIVVLILGLIVLGSVLNYLKASLRRGRAALVPLKDIRGLCANMSPEGLDVLNWAWKDQTQPVTVGILQTTMAQIGTGRVRKLALARAQQAELSAALKTSPAVEPAVPSTGGSAAPAGRTGHREPTLLA